MHYLLLLSGFSWVHFWVTVNWMCSCLLNNLTQMKDSKTPTESRVPQKSFFWGGLQSRFRLSVTLCYNVIVFAFSSRWNSLQLKPWWLFLIFHVCLMCEVSGQDTDQVSCRKWKYYKHRIHVPTTQRHTHTHVHSIPVRCSHAKKYCVRNFFSPLPGKKEKNIICYQQAAAIISFTYTRVAQHITVHRTIFFLCVIFLCYRYSFHLSEWLVIINNTQMHRDREQNKAKIYTAAKKIDDEAKTNSWTCSQRKAGFCPAWEVQVNLTVQTSPHVEHWGAESWGAAGDERRLGGACVCAYHST